MEVDFRTDAASAVNDQTQLENAWSIGEQLSRDLEFYANQGVTGRSVPFRSLTWFWGVILGAVCLSGATLELLGPPPRTVHATDTSGSSAWAGGSSAEHARAQAAAPTKQSVTSTRSLSADAVAPSRLDAMETPAPATQQGSPTSVGTVIPPTVSEPNMVALPGATFHMGSNDDPSERPAHAVVVAPFFLASSAVTVREWQECVGASACTLRPKGRPDQPVTNVSWDDARGFTAWLSTATNQAYRLPTEAEWEYAARAGTDTQYSWGEAMLPGKTSCKGCGAPVSVQDPPSVSAYPPNPFGLYGMGGGVAEWVADCWHRDYQGAPRDGSTPWDSPDCRERVLRGGSWVADASDLRVSSRDDYDASVRYPTHGFRVARTN